MIRRASQPLPLIDRSATDSVVANDDAYFSANPAPDNLEEVASIASRFIEQHACAQRRVVLITSGGTTVPLERQTVRFVDNFSAGTRGATSAEYFLEAGYAVIFLHREFSLQPYSRHFSHSRRCFLDFMQIRSEGSGSEQVSIDSAYQAEMLTVLKKYKKVGVRHSS